MPEMDGMSEGLFFILILGSVLRSRFKDVLVLSVVERAGDFLYILLIITCAINIGIILMDGEQGSFLMSDGKGMVSQSSSNVFIIVHLT